MPGCTLIILSDANTVFINEVLKHHKLDQYIHKVSCWRTRPVALHDVFTSKSILHAMLLHYHHS